MHHHLQNLQALCNQSIRVLAVHASGLHAQQCRAIFESFSPVFLKLCCNCREAAVCIQNADFPYHVCIIDTILHPELCDEHDFIQKYAADLSIIVITSSKSPAAGAHAIKKGACAVIDKDSVATEHIIRQTVHCFLERLFTPPQQLLCQRFYN